MFDRRRFLGSTALGVIGTAAALVAGRPARAFLREGPDPVAESIYLRACETQRTHLQLVADLAAQLEGQETPVRAREIVLAMNCPICGCKLADAVDPAMALPPR
ncbi:MAG: hypothetical protein HY057_04010 [Rhodospirillales bacterium]|nr:hypothetical protein [Rhodospirillales bacterium]